MSPLFLEFLMGKRNFECTPWGMPGVRHFRLAEALLSAAGRLRGDVSGTAGFHGLVEVRLRIGQSEVRQLHAAFGV